MSSYRCHILEEAQSCLVKFSSTVSFSGSRKVIWISCWDLLKGDTLVPVERRSRNIVSCYWEMAVVILFELSRALALVVAYIVILATYRLYFGPLAKFPGPKIAGMWSRRIEVTNTTYYLPSCYFTLSLLLRCYQGRPIRFRHRGNAQEIWFVPWSIHCKLVFQILN